MLHGWITFGNEKFRWKYKNQIEIRPYHRKNNRLLIEIENQCLLKLINKRLKNDNNSKITHIPPEFITKAIKKAVENNWNPTHDLGETVLYFYSNEFTTKK